MKIKFNSKCFLFIKKNNIALQILSSVRTEIKYIFNFLVRKFINTYIKYPISSLPWRTIHVLLPSQVLLRKKSWGFSQHKKSTWMCSVCTLKSPFSALNLDIFNEITQKLTSSAYTCVRLFTFVIGYMSYSFFFKFIGFSTKISKKSVQFSEKTFFLACNIK
jgi:hypothetical protein